MLSEDLQSLYSRMGEYTDSGMVLDPQGVEMVRAILKAAIEDAEELESRTVPFADQVTELPDNVVQIAKVLARKGVHVGPRLHGSDHCGGPEDAA